MESFIRYSQRHAIQKASEHTSRASNLKTRRPAELIHASQPKGALMDVAIFFLPIALLVAQYLMPSHKNRSSMARGGVQPEGCDA
jgi:hypothetical protein